VDPQGRIIGRLTVDEVVDVIREESEQDVLAQAGLREEEDLFCIGMGVCKKPLALAGVKSVHCFFCLARDRRI